MRLLLNEWRKFLDEGKPERSAWNPGQHEPLTRGELRAGDGWTKDEEASQALADIQIALGRAVGPAEEALLVRAGQGRGFWGEFIFGLQGSESKEEFFNLELSKLNSKESTR